MRGVNKVILVGNVGKDPDIQYFEGNIPVSKFPLATTENYKDKTGKLISQTEWHNIVLWRGLVELAQKYLHKSSLVYIGGHLKTRYWIDREHKKKGITEIIADHFVVLDNRLDIQTGQESHDATQGSDDLSATDSENQN